MTEPCNPCTGPVGAPRTTLVCGTEVCTWCPRWREETGAREREARWMLRMASRDVRRAHLAAREAEHGPEYRRRLEATVMAIWQRRQASFQEPANE